MNKDQSTLTSFIGLDREIDSWLEKRSNIDVEIEELIREMARQVFVALGGEARDDEILSDCSFGARKAFSLDLVQSLIRQGLLGCGLYNSPFAVPIKTGDGAVEPIGSAGEPRHWKLTHKCTEAELASACERMQDKNFRYHIWPDFDEDASFLAADLDSYLDALRAFAFEKFGDAAQPEKLGHLPKYPDHCDACADRGKPVPF